MSSLLRDVHFLFFFYISFATVAIHASFISLSHGICQTKMPQLSSCSEHFADMLPWQQSFLWKNKLFRLFKLLKIFHSLGDRWAETHNTRSSVLLVSISYSKVARFDFKVFSWVWFFFVNDGRVVCHFSRLIPSPVGGLGCWMGSLSRAIQPCYRADDLKTSLSNCIYPISRKNYTSSLTEEKGLGCQ